MEAFYDVYDLRARSPLPDHEKAEIEGLVPIVEGMI
jgi:hypothetical protein